MELARCNLLVTNDIVTRHYAKGPQVVYLQTWHGSPLKVIGLHESTPKYRRGKTHLKRTLRDAAKWDYLLSPGRAHTEIYRGAFRYEGEILEFGYPRNDILVNDDGTRRARTRELLGVGPNQPVVLYAPTWRDDAHLADGGFYQPDLVDWARLFRELPDDYVVLHRVHQHVDTAALPDIDSRLIDVSKYDDMSELILASDALVSDYSSVIYDYAVYGRPIILHAPDLVHYRDNLRAFYFDFESWAPGPITSTTAELAENLSDLSALQHVYGERYQVFKNTFCSYENGNSSRRIVDLLIDRHLD